MPALFCDVRVAFICVRFLGRVFPQTKFIRDVLRFFFFKKFEKYIAIDLRCVGIRIHTYIPVPSLKKNE